MSAIQIGQTVPTFSAQSNQGTIESQALIGQPFVLYFYPRDNTPGCTNEAKDFEAKLAEFEQLGVKVIGASRSEEHTSELQSRGHLVCRLLLEKKNKRQQKQ